MFKKLFKTSYLKEELDALSKSQAVIHFKPDGTIVSANENFLNAMGYDAEEVIGQHHSMFVDPDYAQSDDYQEFWHNLGQGIYTAQQFQRFGKGGKEIWIQASYNPIFDEKNDVVQVVKYATDITAQKLQNADYNGQIDAISKSQAVIEFDLDGTIITANENFLATMGYTLEEVQGQHHKIFADPEYAESPEYSQFWDQMRSGEFFAGEFQRFGKGGKEIWIQASYNPIFDMNGNPFKVVKYATDITDEKIKNANYSGQIEAISKSQAVIEFNLDGTIITANENFLGAMGYTLEEVQGQHHRMFVLPEDKESEAYKGFWQRLAKGEFDARAYKRLTKSGDEIWIQASYNPIFDMNGKPFKVVKYASDITRILHTANIADEAATNVQSVAAAIEELSSSVNEISSNMTSSRSSSQEIFEASTQTDIETQKLVESMGAMENVTTLISDIAEQINLLALNATIESARAGDAGKGFAVVANEVKSLANQTTAATQDIKAEIESVQVISQGVANHVRKIKELSENVTERVSGTATAVEEQSAMTNEISGNIQSAAIAVGEIASRIKELSE